MHKAANILRQCLLHVIVRNSFTVISQFTLKTVILSFSQTPSRILINVSGDFVNVIL